jgi:hypothetical protein
VAAPSSQRRALHIACGAALFNLRLAVAVAGRQPVVRLLPDPGQPLLLATVRLAAPWHAQQHELELHVAGHRDGGNPPLGDYAQARRKAALTQAG